MRTIALMLTFLIAGAPVAAQQPAAPPIPTAAEIAALEAEIAAAEAAVREAEAAVREAETAERIAEAEARAEAAEAEAARVAEEAARIVDEAESLGAATPAIQTLGQRFRPAPQGPRRSVARTTGGVAMVALGVLFLYERLDKAATHGASEDRARSDLRTVLASWDQLKALPYWRRPSNYAFHLERAEATYRDVESRIPMFAERAEQARLQGILIGAPLAVFGVLLASKWAHTGADTVAVNVSPDGIRASKTFGW